VVVLAVDEHSGEILAGPDVINRGFVFDEAAEPILEEARARTLLALQEAPPEEVSDPGLLKQHIRRRLSKYFFETTQRKPVIVPVIMEV
jgi:ribonuclease J